MLLKSQSSEPVNIIAIAIASSWEIMAGPVGQPEAQVTGEMDRVEITIKPLPLPHSRGVAICFCRDVIEICPAIHQDHQEDGDHNRFGHGPLSMREICQQTGSSFYLLRETFVSILKDMFFFGGIAMYTYVKGIRLLSMTAVVTGLTLQ